MQRLLTLVLATALAMPFAAAAQSYPDKPIRFIVPYPPGGNNDIVARIYAQKLSERLGQSMVVDNRGGAAGTLGVGLAVKAPNDGYTVVIGDLGSLIIAPLANPAVGYSYRDLTPIGLMATVSIVVSANPNSPDNSIDDFLDCLCQALTAVLRTWSAVVILEGEKAYRACVAGADTDSCAVLLADPLTALLDRFVKECACPPPTGT